MQTTKYKFNIIKESLLNNYNNTNIFKKKMFNNRTVPLKLNLYYNYNTNLIKYFSPSNKE